MSKKDALNYPGFFQRYISLVQQDELPAAFDDQLKEYQQLLSSISEEKSLYAYAEGKWTLREMLQHIIDAERIFCYRALCFSRQETQGLPGFEENDYAANSYANTRSWESLVKEFFSVRNSTQLMFESFTPDMFKLSGIANNTSNSVEGVGFLIIGHAQHHKNIIEERYLVHG